jgi:hypothetical protein
MGQKKPVQAFLLVTEETLEEKLLTTLSTKHDLARAALDPEVNINAVNFASGVEELKRRLEVLLGARPDAALDESRKAEVEREISLAERKEKVAEAGGRLLEAAFAFLGEMLPPKKETESFLQMTAAIQQRLSDCLDKDEKGRLRMTFTLPEESVVNRLAQSLAQILGPAMGSA